MTRLIQHNRIPVRKLLTIGILPSFLKIWFYRLRGAQIGQGVHIGFGSIVDSEDISIGDGTSIGFATIIRGRTIAIGKRVKIGSAVFIDVPEVSIADDAMIREQVLVGGLETPDSSFTLGIRSHVRQGCNINTSKPVVIGSDTAIGGHSLIFTHSSWQSRLEGYPCTFAPVSIGDNVWISWDVFILPGVTIGDGVLIGAGSVVTRDIPDRSLASGNPAKVVIPGGAYPRPLEKDEQAGMMQDMMHEFIRFLKHYKFTVQTTSRDGLIQAVVNDNNGQGKTYQFVYSENDAHYDNISLNERSCVISLSSIDTAERRRLQALDCMWVDVESHQRWGSNAIGEEMVDFLMRYGLRFKRVD